MYSRFIAPLFCIAAIAFACGPRPHSSAAAVLVPAKRHAADTPIASSVTVRVNEGVALALHVTNNTDKQIEINFSNGQTHDFRVVDSTGRVVWRWSEGRMFTQTLQNKLLDAGETLTYEEQWKRPDARGELTAIATLESTNHPVETRVEFTLP